MISFLRIFFLSFMIAVGSAYAAPDRNYVDLRLIPLVDKAVAGERFEVILEQTIHDGWHTYWKNPGESGFPIQVKWDVPDGVEVGVFQWPVPHALEVQGIMNFVHEEKARLLTTVSVPEDFVEEELIINMSADWLVCLDICIPESGDVSLKIPVGLESAPANQDIYDSTIKGLPLAYPSSLHESVNSKLFVDADSHQVIVEIDDNNAFTENVDDTTQPVIYFPYDWGFVAAGSHATVEEEGGRLRFTFPRAERDVSEIETFQGVLAQGDKGILIDVKSLSVIEVDAQPRTENKTTLLTALVFALFGGLILNLMPCVFPILSMKALSLVKIASKDRMESFKHGASYTAGILLSFLALAGALIALKAGGAEIGWGFQLQNPYIVMVISWLLFVVGLNLFGAFDITGRFTQIGSTKVANAQGYTQDFFTGILAVIVATPCTAPFMGVALGYALVQPAIVTLLVFLALGFGLALPFLLLSVVPGLQKIMPKPGNWMETFKQFLAFPMWATTIWLAWVLVQQTGAQGLVAVLSGMLIISFAVWLMAHKPTGVLKGFKVVLLILCALGLWKTSSMLQTMKIEQIAYSPTVLENALQTKNPVFVNMTADWCITCKVNEVALKSDQIQALFQDKNVTYIEGDWTLMNKDITKYLESFDRTGVPLYVYYKADDRENPIVLPQILTPTIIEETLK